jgi:lipooligosaccharide transport system permease protein
MNADAAPRPRRLDAFGNVSARALRVWRRDFEVFRTTLLVNFLPPMLEPVLYIVAFGFGMGSLVETVPWRGTEVRYLTFVVPGVIAIAVMFQSYFETTYSSFVRMYYQRTFDAMLATPLLVEDVIVGEWLWGATRAVMAGGIMLVMVSLFGQVQWPEALWVVPISLVGGLLFSGLGLITTALVPAIDQFNLPTFIVIFPMFLFSGTFFPMEVLPDWALWIAWALPLTHLSSLLRGACLGQAPEATGWSLLYLGAMTLAAGAAALLLMKRRLVK